MRKSLQCQILVSVLAMSVIGLPANVQAASGGDGSQGGNYQGNSDSNYQVVIEQGETFNNVYGRSSTEDVLSASVTMTGGTAANVFGGYTDNSDVINNSVELKSNSTVNENVYGGYINRLVNYDGTNSKGNMKNNIVTIDNSTVHGYVHGGYINAIGNPGVPFSFSIGVEINGNKVNISSSTVDESVYGGRIKMDSIKSGQRDINTNHVNIDNSTIVGSVYGGIINNGSLGHIEGNTVTISGSSTVNTDVYGGFLQFSTGFGAGAITDNTVKIDSSTVEGCVYGGKIEDGGSYDKVEGNTVEISGDGTEVGTVYGGYGGRNSDAGSNKVEISGGTVTENIYGGYAENGDTTYNSITLSGDTDVSGKALYGGYSKNGIAAYNSITLSEAVDVEDATIYGGYSENGNTAYNNSITLSETASVSGADLYGSNLANTDTNTYTQSNNLIINGWSGSVNSVNNFNNINFQNLKWENKGTVLAISSAGDNSLAGTGINIESISVDGGQKLTVGDYMYIIKGQDGAELGTEQDKINAAENFTAGVAIDGTGEIITEDNGNVKFEVTGTSVNDQTMLVAENRVVAAAFVNQGTDLISDSMDVLSRDGKYGVKTFAAVHGNRSKYDVNSDIKINGWSSIVGVGSEKNVGNGDFSWGVFYENGSGNYRTYNEFNNEFFRGDGSLVYNGGGIAARYEQDNGVYTEGSLRAGMLKSEMSNALKDGAGNSYGYKSESTYYGAHLGVGKVIALDEGKDLDVYGKFFHTYTDGDSFNVAGDKFEFDSITSDRLRVGARLTTNKENKVSTYYGLAYEYEFNGDANMKAQNMSAPEQSLQGSSYMAEVGMNYQPDADSPWSFDLNMRGYAGEREGASFNVQATYTF